MASRLPELSGVEPFSIDQTRSVEFDGDDHLPASAAWVKTLSDELTTVGGTAGFLAEEAPPGWPLTDVADAYLLSTDNAMT